MPSHIVWLTAHRTGVCIVPRPGLGCAWESTWKSEGTEIRTVVRDPTCAAYRPPTGPCPMRKTTWCASISLPHVASSSEPDVDTRAQSLMASHGRVLAHARTHTVRDLHNRSRPDLVYTRRPRSRWTYFGIRGGHLGSRRGGHFGIRDETSYWTIDV